MTKYEILEKYTGITPDSFSATPGIYKAMDEYAIQAADDSLKEYAKKVLCWLLTRSHSDYEGERIVMIDDAFWWDSDEDGDFELGPEEIIKLYENDKRKSDLSGRND